MSRLKLTDRLNAVLNKRGFHLLKFTHTNSYKSLKRINLQRILLNIGSGDWECEGWINLDYPSEHYGKVQRRHKIIPYDIRNDNVPYDDEKVDAIYCSHVIEHLEDKHIRKLFEECYRVLKKGGVFRITCPDAEFLYNIAQNGDAEWWHECRDYYAPMLNSNSTRAIDFLVHEVAAPYYLKQSSNENSEDYQHLFSSMSMYDFLNYITSNLQFDEKHPGSHINYWTYDKAKKMLQEAGFSAVIHSKPNTSICSEMRNIRKFDTNFQRIALYVDAIKK